MMRVSALALLVTTADAGRTIGNTVAHPHVATNPPTVQCDSTTDFEIKVGGEKWTPKVCGFTGELIVQTCGHTGSLMDTRIYDGPCKNDDHGGQCPGANDRFHSYCKGHVTEALQDANGCVTLSVGGYYHEGFQFGLTGTASLQVTCIGSFKQPPAVTYSPTTLSPTTESPTTEAPTTEAPTTEAPTTEAPKKAGCVKDPFMTCGQALTCVGGLQYPTTCGPSNCDAALGVCPQKPGTGGDPFTTYKGKTSQFWAPAGKPLDLMRCGPWTLRASVFNTGTGHQWFKDFSVWRNERTLANISISSDVQDLTPEDLKSSQATGPATVVVQTNEWTLRESGVGQSLQGGEAQIATANLRGANEGRFEIRALITPNGKHHGFHSAMISCDDEVGGSGLAFEISSAPAVKLGTLHDRLRHAHLDLDFLPSFNAEKTPWGPCTGVLPEVWGTQPLSEQVSQMLVPPKAAAVEEAQSDE